MFGTLKPILLFLIDENILDTEENVRPSLSAPDTMYSRNICSLNNMSIKSKRFGTSNYIFIQFLYGMLHDLLILKKYSSLLGI